ncbi:MAG: NUDIX hydrolase [Kineosporiaceae bacterium]
MSEHPDGRDRPATGRYPQPESLPEWLEGVPMARPATAAGALLRDGSGRLLLVDPVYKDGLDLPGGILEPGETPTQGLVRELGEELGVALPVGRLLVVDWCPDPVVGDKLLWVFDVGVLDPALERDLHVDPAELAGWEWVEPAAVADRCPRALARRIALAVAALGAGRTAYAEFGEPLPGE